MPTSDYYFERADDLAQKIMDDWQASDKPVSPEFQSLFDKASQYLIAKRIANQRHNETDLSGPDQGEEMAAGMAFADAYKNFEEKRKAAGA